MGLNITLTLISVIFLSVTATAAFRTRERCWFFLALIWAFVLGVDVAGLVFAIVEQR